MLRTPRIVWLGMLLSVVGPTASARPLIDDPETFFELKVRPVLSGSCVKCHGPDKVSGELRLDSKAALLEGGSLGPAIEPGDPANSLLIQAIRDEHETLSMPPTGPMDKEAVANLVAWVESGAYWPEANSEADTLDGDRHWAFQPLQAVAPPEDPNGWAEGVIDQFLALEHRARGLQPVATASRHALIRRATFDLTGLPPTPEEIEAFVQDEASDAFERLVERLLASPRYGERWGRYWLDLARYADTAGDNSDYPIPEAYLYRDYVIDAFNADLPYDQFLQEQLAGDLLALEGPPEDYARQVIATGFLAQSKRFGTHKLEDMHLIIEDTLNTTGQVVLGLSLRCARCHDHKYDPITERDYYGLYGFFASTRYPFAGAEEERRPSEFAALLPPDQLQPFEAAQAERIAEVKAQIEKIEQESEPARTLSRIEQELSESEQRLEQVESSAREELADRIEQLKARQAKARDALDEALKPQRDALTRLEQQPPWGPDVPVAYAVREGTPTDAPIQKGGNHRDLGDVVPRGVPRIFVETGTLAIPEGRSGRLELARWLTEHVDFLTARVMVNRIWQHHFGKPIVATPSDFGVRGATPTHPELLDWLALDFIDSGWSIKALHRRIMLSKAYQLSSAHDPENAERDSGNTWYWRFDRRRLDAEAIRDTLLQLSGRLEPERPGPHPFPPKHEWRFTAHHQFKAEYPSNHRSVYLMVQRLHPHSYLALFNGPDTSMTTPLRDSSTVPLQALYLLNSDFVAEQAEGFARRLLQDVSEPSERLDRGYRLVFGRTAREPERKRALEFLDQYAQALALEGDRLTPDRIEQEAWVSLARALLASNEFIYVD